MTAQAATIERPEEIIQNPHNLKTYIGNDQIKDHRADIGVKWEAWEEHEYMECALDINYFAESYVKVIHLDHGLIPFKPYPYQKRMYETVDDNRFSIVLAPRQSGKSIAFVIWLLHYAIFNPNKTVVIAANKLDTAIELLDRIKLAMENLPFFLQPGCREYNKKSVVLSNGSKIYARATGKDTLRGLSANVVYLDEFAFVDNSAKFYTSTYPVISSGQKTKLIITSTANGVGNMFYTLWDKAVKKKNDFGAFEVKWNDVPGRDEKWRKETIARTSERQFMQEFENRFLGSGNTLIDGEVLLALQAIEPEWQNKNLKMYEQPKDEHEYVLAADVSKGVGGDASTFSIIDITSRPFRQVAVFQDDMIAPILFAEIIVKYAKLYGNAYVCVESNDLGALVNYAIYENLDYENLYHESWKDTSKIGLLQTMKTKRIGCSHFKEMVEGGKLIIQDDATIQEICKFEERGGTYQAATGCHDDLVMALVGFSYLASTERFKNEFDVDMRDVLYTEEMRENLTRKTLPPQAIVFDYDDYDANTLFEYRDEDSITKFKVDDTFGVVYEEINFEEEGQNYLY